MAKRLRLRMPASARFPKKLKRLSMDADGKPKVLQLSHSADDLEPLIGVIQLEKVFARTRSITRNFYRRRSVLRQLFSHPKLRIVGVSVKGDITWLAKLEGSEDLIGDPADIKGKCLDLASYEQRVSHLAGGAQRGYYSLDSICRRHLGRKLLKNEPLRQSKWSRAILREDQIVYAAKDAWAGSLVMQALNKLAHTHRKPTSQELSTGVPVRLSANRWNIDRAIERGLMPREYDGLYELHLIEEIKIMALNDQLSDERVHEALVGSGDFGDERYLFDELMESSRGSSATNENAYTSLDMDRMAREWNDRVEEERHKGENIYPKTAGLLKSFFTKRAERKNRERALATEVGGTPVSDTVDKVRRSLLQKDRGYNFESVQSEPRPVERDSSKPSAGTVSRVPVPPMQVQVGGSEAVRQLVQAEAHVTRPQPHLEAPRAARRRNPPRCMRCGKKKGGSLHKVSAQANSLEYCKVPEADKTPHWRVPPGYAVGDTRQKEKQGNSAREWRRICKDNSYGDEGWEGWGNRY